MKEFGVWDKIGMKTVLEAFFIALVADFHEP